MENELGEDIIFVEATAAAQSLKSSWTRLASTYNCIQVILSREHLIIKPRKLAGWLIDLLRLDLRHTIATHQITSVEPGGRRLSYEQVKVMFSDGQGAQQGLLLYLRKSGEFLEQIGQLVARPSTG